MFDRTPYTYYIKWSTTGIWYYGVRYAKGCHPSDLWKSYKTSSNFVKQYVEMVGDPDIIKITKVFLLSQDAKTHEENFLLRVDAQHHPKSLNYRNVTGRIDTSSKVSESNKRRFSNPKILLEYSLMAKEYYSDEENRKKHLLATTLKNPARNKIWINDGTKSIRIFPELIDNYPTYIKGRLVKKEWYLNRQKMNRDDKGRFVS